MNPACELNLKSQKAPDCAFDFGTCLAGAQDIWRKALEQAEFRSPLLILDEAHHLKNPATEIASLFVTAEAKDDADAITGMASPPFGAGAGHRVVPCNYL